MKDKIKELEYQRKYRESHREHIRARDKELKRKKYKHYHEQNRLWRLKNPDKVKEYAERYRKSGAQKWSQIKSRYGIDKAQFESLLEQQKGRCPICRDDFKIRKPYIDHNHTSDKVRGLLHRECNALLGFAEEKMEVLQNAINYIKKYEDTKSKEAAFVCSGQEGLG
jgi:hypothetical protein